MEMERAIEVSLIIPKEAVVELWQEWELERKMLFHDRLFSSWLEEVIKKELSFTAEIKALRFCGADLP